MSTCKACGMPSKIIRVNRNLMKRIEKLTELAADLKKERTELRAELRSVKRKLESAKLSAENSRTEMRLAQVELKASFTARLDLEARLNSANWAAEANARKAERLAEKMKHIKDLAAKPDEWLRIGCRNG